MNTTNDLSKSIKEKAIQLGFDRCGIAQVHVVDTSHYEEWIQSGYHAEMGYLNNHTELRRDPSLLLSNAKSIIICAANYYPKRLQSTEAPQVAYFAYGKDYHKWLKKRLRLLETHITQINPHIHTRSFVDTAPILERYWAAQAGIGFIGKNNILTIPNAGSFFLLGGIIIDAVTDYDLPLTANCGSCTICIEACPSKALISPYRLDARKCLSYRTIEHKGDWDSLPKVAHHNNFFGCDACQKSCPFNRFATPTQIEECTPLSYLDQLPNIVQQELDQQSFDETFQSSPIRRIRIEGFSRNTKALNSNNIKKYPL